MSFLRLLFWGWRKDRAGRLGFVGCSAAIWAVLFWVLSLLPDPLEENVETIGSGVPIGLLVAIAAFGLLALLASLNLAAKRIRDIGAPGWIVVIGLTLLNGILILAAPRLAYPWFSVAVFAVLSLTPSGALATRK